jgi:predicted RNase H-like HicB family nuclease
VREVVEPAAYTVLFEYFRESGHEGYQVHVPALPEIVTWGRTLDEAKANAQEALECVVGSMRETGEPLPPDVDVEPVVHIEKFHIAA